VPYAQGFTDFVQHAFSSRRKKLSNNLAVIFRSLGRSEILRRLGTAGIAANARPEELSIAEFLRVYNQFTLCRPIRNSKWFLLAGSADFGVKVRASGCIERVLWATPA